MTKVKDFVTNMVGHTFKARAFFFGSVLIVLALCALLVVNVWIQSQDVTKEEALKLAAIAEAGIAIENLKKLDLNERDLKKLEYVEIKESLQHIRAAHKDIRFAYIIMQRDGKTYFAADSEPTYSKDYSPPGQEFMEATTTDLQPFKDGKAVFSKSTDRWGTWVSVMIPMKDYESGEVIAVFGVDYTLQIWYRHALDYTKQAAAVCLCTILMYLALVAVLRTNASIRREITEREKTEKELQERERSYAVLLSNLPGMAYRCKYDPEWTILFASEGCYGLTGYHASSLINNAEVALNEVISPKYREYLWNQWIEVIQKKARLAEEYEIITANGSTKWVFEQGQPIFDEDGNLQALEGLIIDISDRKKKEEEIVFLNYHDFLTGLYNRRFLEDSKEQIDKEQSLPISVMIGDINGLKLVNDAFGHEEGDTLIVETAKIIQRCCRPSDITARTGGDEFMVLMPKTDAEQANDIMNQIKQRCENYNRNLPNDAYSLNISLGFATKETMNDQLNGIIKVAEDFMYKRKLLEHKSSHSAILSSIKATMQEKSHETQEHAERLTYLSKELGRTMNLSEQEMDELELLATLHDIGKVGISDQILNKPDKLTSEEWIEMKKHSEIGYRIAMSSPDIAPIAEFILSLHERWDGAGYPQGLAGIEIPLLSRIVSVVDAYDAMTEDRPYRKAMSNEEAASELKDSAGTQFDPKIIQQFLERVLPNYIKE
jgi:diguanylate cyclase (GGDEF)-like protein/PAS domain S-box-containing protein